MTLTENQTFAKFGPKTEMCPNFYEIWHLEQIEHADYEHSYFEFVPVFMKFVSHNKSNMLIMNV